MRAFILTLALSAGLLATATAEAGHYSVGAVYDGYTLHSDGYWHKNGHAYTLKEWTEQVWDAYRCRYYSQLYYRYEPVQVSQLTYKDPNWRAKVVDLLRDKQESDSFEATMRALGLDYSGAPGGYGYHASQIAKFYGTSGSTAYVQVQQIQQPSLLDTNVAFQQAARLNDQVTRSQAQGFEGLLEAIKLGNAGQLDIERMRAAGQLTIEAMRAAAPSATIRTDIRSKEPPATMPKLEGPMALNVVDPKLLAVDTRYACTACHEKQGVKYSIAGHAGLDRAAKVKVIERLVSKDPKLHMPKGGHDLADDEVLLFLK